MGWVWVIFLLVSVLTNLLEKMGKEQQASQQSVPDRERKADLDESWRPTEDFPGTPAEVFPQSKPKPAPAPVGNFAPAQHQDYPNQQEDLLTAEERDHLLRPQLEFEAEGPLFTVSYEEDIMAEEDFLGEEGREDQASSFRTAFLLAQVLARPDFTTVPWRRRL